MNGTGKHRRVSVPNNERFMSVILGGRMEGGLFQDAACVCMRARVCVCVCVFVSRVLGMNGSGLSLTGTARVVIMLRYILMFFRENFFFISPLQISSKV